MLKVGLNLDPLLKLNRKIAASVIKQSAAAATNKTLTKVRGIAATRMRRQLKARADLVRKSLLVRRAKGTNATGAVFLKKGGLPLIALGAERTEVLTSRGLRLGALVEIDGRKLRIPGAFLAEMPNGYEGVFRRKREKRLPIREVFTRELLEGREFDIFADSQLQADMRSSAEAFFPKAFSESFEKRFNAAAEG